MLIDQEDGSHVNEHDHDDDDVDLNMLLDQEIDEHDDNGDTQRLGFSRGRILRHCR